MQPTFLSPRQQISSHKPFAPAVFLSVLLGLVALFSILWIIFAPDYVFSGTENQTLWADIYQNGERIEHINLTEVVEPYTFLVTGEDGCTNEITVQKGSIGITGASCPDKICVKQGFITSSLLPITCLPNHLVIRIHAEKQTPVTVPDIVTY